MSHRTTPATRDHDACTACTSAPDALGPDRRAFLRDAALAVGAALLAVGGSPLEAFARPLAFTSPLASTAETHSYAVPAQDGAEIDKANEIILVRWQGAVYAFNLSCPHQNTALRWLGPEGRFQCPKHKSKYRPDGTFIEGRATRGMDRFSVSRQGSAVVVNVDVLHKQDEDPQAWAAALVKL